MADELLDLQDPVEEPIVHAAGVVPSGEERERLEQGLALSLSGGGYRAMIYHVGALWRLNELGLLPKLKRISSVSGGSITAAVLGKNWSQLNFAADGVAPRANFESALVAPIRSMARVTIDIPSVGWGLFTPFQTIGDTVARYYDQHLFNGASLASLPEDADGPRFVINATNVKTGSLWRFSRPYMADYRVGLVLEPKLLLATAVAASSAFPPFLSPTKLDLSGFKFDKVFCKKEDEPSLLRQAVLTDGGVYDNLGLEPIWKRYSHILVSDAGRRMSDDLDPAVDWAMHSRRLLDLLQFQTSNLRRRQIMSAFLDAKNPHHGAYWNIQADVGDGGKFPAANKLPFGLKSSTELAQIETRLAEMPDVMQERLINWGYAICDASLRSHFPQDNPFIKIDAAPPPKFPYAHA